MDNEVNNDQRPQDPEENVSNSQAQECDSQSQEPQSEASDQERDSGQSKKNDAEEKTGKKFSKGKIALVVAGVLVVICIIGSLLPCNHDWSEASCTEPKTCTLCGETEGDPLGHDWINSTCTHAKQFSLC